MGLRRHLCRIETGQALFGMDLGCTNEGFRILAVGVADTVLLELRRLRFVELKLTKDPAYADRVIALLKAGGNMSVAVARQHLLPQESAAGAWTGDRGMPTTRSGAGGTGSGPASGGESRFLGDPDLPPISGGSSRYRTRWLESSGGTTLPGMDTESYVAQNESWSDLDGFIANDSARPAWETAAFVRRAPGTRAREGRRRPGTRQERRARLSAVLETEKTRDVSPDITTDDPLLAAC